MSTQSFVMQNLHDNLIYIVVGYYLVASSVAFVAVASDKHAAAAGRRRTAERKLHLLSAAGGWPGTWLACRAFRHKTQKLSFQRRLWLAIALNFALFACMVFVGQRIWSWHSHLDDFTWQQMLPTLIDKYVF